MPKSYDTRGEICLQCGQSRESIKRNKTYCATMSHTEMGSEVDQEWPRHRFKPYSQRELESQARDEAEYIKQMGEFANFVLNQELKLKQP